MEQSQNEAIHFLFDFELSMLGNIQNIKGEY